MSTVFPLADLDDRRARARLQRRQHIEQLLEYALPLPPKDRLVLEFVLNRGQSLAQIAALTGSGVSSLQRRFRALCRHLQSPLYRFFFHHHRQLPSDLEHTGRLVFFQRLSLRRAAAAQDLPLFQVRQQLHALQTLAGLHRRTNLQTTSASFRNVAPSSIANRLPSPIAKSPHHQIAKYGSTIVS